MKMCFCNKVPEPNKQNSPRSPRSPWRRQKEPMKPKLSRKIVPSARVNLNAYWSKFEDLSKKKASIVTFDIPPTAEILMSSMFTAFHDNEINENLVNELLELGGLLKHSAQCFTLLLPTFRRVFLAFYRARNIRRNVGSRRVKH